MGRITTVIWMASIAIAAFGLYLVKYTVADLKREVDLAEAQVKEEREALHLLNAEWAYLNRPERLRSLADAHLNLAPVQVQQIQPIQSLPAAYDAPVQPTPGIQQAVENR